MGKKISVVIPVYNVEPNYINNAINSVLNQTYKNIEIIIVNDGSTDEKTLEYLKSIDNPIIKIISQENKGLGGARNTGIENSSGEYIGFLDADDWLDNNLYETLMNLCEVNNADVACGTLTRVVDKKQFKMDHFKNVVLTDFADKMKLFTNGSVCSKLFKKEMFSGIRFKEHLYFEDNPVLVGVFVKSNKVAFTNTVKYYYRENPVSICLNTDSEKIEKRKKDKLFILNEICGIIHDKSQKEKDAVFEAVIPILVDGKLYNSNTDYKLQIQSLLSEKCEKYLSSSKNSFIENVFSIKNSAGKTHKIITILWIKFKIRRKIKKSD